MRRIYLILIAAAMLVFALTPAAAADEPNIRVGLAKNKSTVSFSIHKGSYEVVEGSSGLPIGFLKEGDTWTVIEEGVLLKLPEAEGGVDTSYMGPLMIQPMGKNSEGIFSCNNVKYRGSLTIYNTDNGLEIVNTLPIDEYLYGVVGKEMGHSAPIEALKAQSLISRSYALRMRGSGVYSDVGTDQLTQVYGGYSAELIPGFDRVKQAVDNTRGEVILYNGQIVEAYYHASAGGHTENSENIWSAALPYLRAVPSPYDQYAIRYPYQSGGWPANTYDWAKKITRSQLASIIMDWNSRRLKDGRVNEIIDIGSLEGIEISRLDANGKETASQRVTELKFIGTTGKKSFYRDNIRSILGLKSTLFDIEFDSKITVLDGNASKVSFNSLKDLKAIDGSGALDYVNPDSDDCFVIGKESTRNIARSFDSLTIKGRGHGHGIGLSQWGAQGMAAEKGANYKEIIRHYYTGVDIKRVD